MNGLLSMMWNNVDAVTDGIFSKMTNINKVKEGDDFSIGTTASNIAPDIYQSGAEFKQILEQPLVFAEEIGDLATGAIGHAFPKTTQTLDSLFNYTGREENMEKASQAMQGILDTYGSKEAFLKEFQERPVSTGAMALGIGSGLKAVTKLSAPSMRRAYDEMELAVAQGMDTIADFGKSIDEIYSQNMGMTRLIGHQGNSTGAIFRELDMNKIGTNTGNSVEGYGIYISGQERTAKQYAGRDNDMLDEFNAMVELQENPIAREVYDRAASGYYPATIRTDMLANLTDPRDIAVFNKTIADVEARYDTATNQIYEIDLDDEAVATFINREAKKLDQPPAVQAEMERLGLPDDADGAMLYASIRNEMLDEIFMQPNMSMLGITRKADKMASEYLNMQGIKGMSFNDRFARASNKGRGRPENNPRNYVIYDTDFAKVKKRQNIDIDKNTPSKEGVAYKAEGILDPRFATRKTDKDALIAGDTDVDYKIQGESNIFIPDIDLRDLEGFSFVSSYADLSRAGGYLTHVNGTKFPNPVAMKGGQDFMVLPENVDRNLLWASHRDATAAIIRQAGEARKLTGADPLYLPFRMSPKGLDFSHQTTDTMLQSALAGLNNAQLKHLDKLIRTTSKDLETGQMINKNWRGIKSENPLKGTTGAERKAIAKIIDVNFRANRGIFTKGQDNGVLSYPQARIANTDPRQLKAKEGTLQNIGQLDLSDNVPNRFSNHDSYNTGIAGSPVGRFTQDLHLLDLVTDIRNNAGKVITRDNITPQDIRKLQMMKPPTGVITHDLLMGLEKQGLL
jgi:hypothetical protein